MDKPRSPSRSPGRSPIRKRLKNTLIHYTVLAVITPLRLLPHRAALTIGAALGYLLSFLPLREVRQARRNIRLALPDLSAARRRRLLRAAAANLGRTALEWLSGPDPGGRKVRFAPGALELLERRLAPRQGLIFVSCHMGNWELMAAAVAARVDHQVAVLFKGSYDPRFTRLMVNARARAGVWAIDVARPGHLAAALRILRAGGVLGVLQDQPVEGGAQVPFLDHPAPSSMLAARLNRRRGIPLLVGTTTRRPGGRHEIRIQEVDGLEHAGSEEEATRLIQRDLGAKIRENPAHWLWSLDRWRGLKNV